VLEKYEEAKKILNYAEKQSNIELADDEKRMKTISMQKAYVKVKLDIHESNYIQADKNFKFYYAMVKQTDHEIFSSSTNNVDTYLKYKLNMNRSAKGYYSDQLYNYSYEEFVKHVKEHHQKENFGSNAMFYEYINLDILLNEINNILSKTPKYYIGLTDEIRYFKFDGIGLHDNNNTNFIEVSTIYGTDNLITCYPKNDIGEFEYTDLNYLKKLVDSSYKKEIIKNDRVEKFYQRLEKTKELKRK
jgi:hypothetical protein